jgi:hypothetical protein
MRSEWGLFVDESGDFVDRDDVVLGAGLLLRTDIAPAGPGPIEAALRSAMPDFPWPIHAAHVNLPVMAALARCARLRSERGPAAAATAGPFTELATSAVAALACTLPDVVEEALGELEHGRRPSLDTVRTLDRRLKALDPALHARLEDRRRQATGHILGVIEELRRRARARLLAATVLSGEGAPGDAMPEEAEGPEADTRRYCAVLECLLGRTYDLLARLPGPHAVEVHVLSRPVADAGGGRSLFDRRRLAELVRRAEPPGARGVTLQAAGTPSYGPSVDPRLVLADFVANHARWALRRGGGLARLERHLEWVTVGALRSGRPSLSHVAATGWARAHIDAARRGAPSAPAPAPVRGWAREQAEQWAEALRPRVSGAS